MSSPLRSTDRRQFLRSVCTGVTGSALVGTVAATDEDGPAPSIRIDDQESNGGSVVIARAASDVEAVVAIENADGDWIALTSSRPELEPGEIIEDETVRLEEPLGETQQVTAKLYESNGPRLATDTATVTVDADSDPSSGEDSANGEEDADREPSKPDGDDQESPEPDDTGVLFVEADPDIGFDYPYYLYTPDRSGDVAPRPILVEPNDTKAATEDFEAHRDAAERAVRSGVGRTVADRLSAPFLVPAFPRPLRNPVDRYHHIQRLDRETMQVEYGKLERVDLQLLNMVADARDRLAERAYPVADGLMLNGFAAAGAFVNRFTALHPEPVRSVTAGGLSGIPILPIQQADGQTLDYHIGIANLESLTGEPFDLEAYREVDQFIYAGEDDSRDAISNTPAWTDEEFTETALDVYGEDMHEDRFPYARAVYHDVGANAVFRTYTGEGHTQLPAVDDIVAFHERSLGGADIEALRADLAGNVPTPYARIEYSPQRPTVGERVGFDASQSDVPGRELLDFAWEFSDGERATGALTTHRFDTAGRHNVTLTVTDDAGETYRSIVRFVVEADSAAETGARTESGDTGDSVPGFAVAETVTTLGGLGYALNRRLTETGHQE